jgi:alcohol dehydrogenase class IV
MTNFNYYQPTEIIFGNGRIEELGTIVSRFGKRCLLVTTPPVPEMKAMYDRVKTILINSNLEVEHFDQVQQNPTTDVVTAGANLAKKFKAEVVIGLGGGSSMDTAKAIAVEATHEGTAWDYLFYKKQPTEKTLPIIAISTTSGTGSQVTQVAVMTNTAERNKSAIYNSIIYPRVALVDPELMLSVPKHITASTGFDVFCHSFESIIHVNSSPYVQTLGWKAIELVVENLPKVLEKPNDLEVRSKMAFADTLAGLCIANAGVTLPHGVGMAISGLYPHIIHGESLAIIYPAFTRFSYEASIPQFAQLSRVFNSTLKIETNENAAKLACKEVDNFLMRIGMWFRLKDFKMPESEIPLLAKNSMILPDYKNNPRIATDSEMLQLIKESYSL